VIHYVIWLPNNEKKIQNRYFKNGWNLITSKNKHNKNYNTLGLKNSINRVLPINQLHHRDFPLFNLVS